MRFNITSVIPTVSYGNIQPSLEIEADSYEDALLLADKQLVSWWDKYYNKLPTTSDFKRLKAFVGGEIDYDSTNHVYMWEGVVYQSGSQYADSFKKPFDKEKISQAVAKRDKREVEDVLAEWELKGEASRSFGTAIHGALELHERYGVMVDNPILKNAVMGFTRLHKETVLNEVLVVDHDKQRAGRIDRLVVLGKNHYLIDDFKTDATTKNKEFWFKQIEFYKEIMENNGAVVDGLRIHHYTGEWKTYETK